LVRKILVPDIEKLLLKTALPGAHVGQSIRPREGEALLEIAHVGEGIGALKVESFSLLTSDAISLKALHTRLVRIRKPSSLYLTKTALHSVSGYFILNEAPVTPERASLDGRRVASALRLREAHALSIGYVVEHVVLIWVHVSRRRRCIPLISKMKRHPRLLPIQRRLSRL